MNPNNNFGHSYQKKKDEHGNIKITYIIRKIYNAENCKPKNISIWKSLRKLKNK